MEVNMKRLVSILLALFLALSFLSCSSNQKKISANSKETTKTVAPPSGQSNPGNQQDKQKESITENKDELTIEDIKAKYTGGDNGKIVNITSQLEDYVLVEYINGGGRLCFDWYNLKTGDKDVLPVGGYNNVKLMRVKDKDNIWFITDGVTYSGQKFFPQIVQCLRNQEVPDYENDFDSHLLDLYLPIDQGVDFGVNHYENIIDVKVSITGVEVQFGPIKGHESDFFSGNGNSIPPAKTSYNKAKNQFIVEFKDTAIGSNIKKSAINDSNKYIKSVYIKQNGSNTILTVNLKDTGKYYTAKFSFWESVFDLPYIDFIFSDVPHSYE